MKLKDRKIMQIALTKDVDNIISNSALYSKTSIFGYRNFCLYFIFDSVNNLEYIGMTESITARIAGHEKKHKDSIIRVIEVDFKDEEALWSSNRELKDKLRRSKLRMLESLMILAFVPSKNNCTLSKLSPNQKAT